MNLLLISKLPESNLYNAINPLILNDQVTKIYLLRDDKYQQINNKIEQIDFKKTRFRIVNHLKKLYIGYQVCKKYKIDLILSIMIYPHGYIGKVLSKLKSIPHVHNIIAGYREFTVYGKVISYINYAVFKKSIIVVTGEKTKKFLLKKKFPEKNIFIIPNVIDIRHFYPLNKEKQFDIISLSRLDSNKNLRLLLHAFSIIKNEFPEIKIGIAGDGPEKENLEFLSNQLSLQNNVNFVGWVSKENTNEFLNRGRIFILTSKGEGFPLSLLEAMSCGLAILTTNVGDISDLVKDNYNGIFINDFNNPEILAQILRSVLLDKNRLVELSKNSLLVRNTHNFNIAANLWGQIFKTISIKN